MRTTADGGNVRARVVARHPGERRVEASRGYVTEGRAIITMRRVCAAFASHVTQGLALVALVSVCPAARALPVDVSGSVGYSFRSLSTDTTDATSNQLLGNLRLRSYIWQPWFATVEGGATLAKDSSDLDDGNASTSTTSDVYSGDLMLNVLPDSRTPFRLLYQATDSRVDNTVVYNPLVRVFGSEYQTTNLDLRQSYITEEGHRAQLRYGARTWDSDLSGTYENEIMGVELDWRPVRQRLLFRGNIETTDQSRTDRHQENFILDVDHYYFPNEDIRLDTKASHYHLDTTFEGATGLVDTVTTEINQVSSFTFWRPVDKRWTVSAGARAYTMAGENSAQSSDQASFGATAGAFYQYSKRLRFDGSANFSQSDINGANQTLHRQRLGALLQSDLIEWRSFTYQWYVSGALENQSDVDENVQSLQASLGHDAQRMWMLDPQSSLRVGLTQAFNEVLTTGDEATQHRLDHSASLGWNQSSTQGATTLVQLTLSDSRNFGDLSDEQQLVNLQASRYQALGARSTLSGHLTLQTVVRDFSGGANDGSVTTTTGQISYLQQTLFSIPRLQFNSDLRLSQASTGEGLDRNEWENRLNYTIGLVDASLSFRWMDNGHEASQLLYFRVMRRF